MLDRDIYEAYLRILKKELTVALGCTEPIAIAYAGAKARQILGEIPDSIRVFCSGNIIKNVKSVTVPKSGGQKGIEAAAVLGVLGGNPDKELEVLESVGEDDIKRCKKLLSEGFCKCEFVKDVANLYIAIEAVKGSRSASVKIQEYHSNITEIRRNGVIIFTKTQNGDSQDDSVPDKKLLNVRQILQFADEVSIDTLRELLDRQISLNSAIAEEGLNRAYGVEVGRTLLREYGERNINNLVRAKAAAGADARMGGCPLPVVINSGSGNQGITVSVPIIEYAKFFRIPDEKLYRALIVGNLLSIHQKRYIGSLSAYCGAVSAACGSGAGIAYLMGMDYPDICNVITNTINTVGGMICDGAKASCAAKVSIAIEAALLAIDLARNHHAFCEGEGLVSQDIEHTIAGMGQVGRVGMKPTDEEIIKLMLCT